MTPRDPALPFIAHQSATSAYRADIANRDGAFGEHDAAWITVASLLEHSALLQEPDRGRLLVDAIEFSREVIGDANLARIGEREWQDRDRTPAEAVLLLAESVHRAGALNLAGTMLDVLLLADTSLNDVQRGRVISHRARVLRKMGLVDEADECSRHVAQLARRTKSDELLVRALLGFATSAQIHGNYPDVYRHTQRAAKLAERAGLTKLARDARNGLMISLGATGRFDEALINGWKVYQSSIGNAFDEGEVLQNLAQLLFKAGHIAEARAGFASVVSQQRPAHLMFPALGGLAIASAETGHPATVEWAASEIETLASSPAPRFTVASALLEAAIGLHRIGKTASAERCRRAAAQLAQKYSFHEIAFRAESLETLSSSEAAAQPRVLTKEAATVADEVAWLEPKQLPEHVALAAASL